jgi:uncharacterized membrane protein
MLINVSGQTKTPHMSSWHNLSLWLHLIALAFWLGGIVFFLIVFAPAVRELNPSMGMRALNQGRMNLEAMSWAAIALLLITGIVNLILRKQGAGGPDGEFYTTVLSIKLFLFLAMVIHHCLQVFKYAPAIVTLTEKVPPETNSWPEPLLSLWQKWFMLLKINAGIGPIVTLFGLALIKS